MAGASLAEQPRWFRLAAGVLVVALVGLLGTAAWLHRGGDDDDAPGAGSSAAVLVAAREGAVLFFSIAPETIEQSVDDLLARSTGAFRTDYEAARDQLVEQVQTKGVSTEAVVPADGLALEYLTADRAQVLVALDTTTTLPSGATELDNHRVRVQLSVVDGTWLVSALEQVG